MDQRLYELLMQLFAASCGLKDRVLPRKGADPQSIMTRNGKVIRLESIQDHSNHAKQIGKYCGYCVECNTWTHTLDNPEVDGGECPACHEQGVAGWALLISCMLDQAGGKARAQILAKIGVVKLVDPEDN